MTDTFSLASGALPPTRVLAFRGTEGISALYHFEIHVLIEDPAFDMGAALEADATLSVNRDDGQPYAFHGILSTLETVAEAGEGFVYRAVLVPRLWRLTLGHHNRVFVDESAPGILQRVLDDAGLSTADYTLKLTASYARLPHVCQYRESSFAFLSRRLEREGIYYFFEQGERRERMVITDDRSVHAALSPDPVRYSRVSGAGAAGVSTLRSFTCRHSAIVGGVRVKDHDYLRPVLDVSGQAVASEGPDEIHLYGENFVTPEEGARLARVRAEEQKARQVVFRGRGRAYFLRPGYTFELNDHPRFDGAYLATELVHAGNAHAGGAEVRDLLGLPGEQGDVYRVEVAAVPASVQFRPERRTPVPRIYGTERAVVDGPADTDYAQLDEHGRYLVRIHFDESAAKAGRASARIRMMQPHGGNPESFHFPLRKGTEVVLTFEGGDPDRPLIAGVVPNLVNPTLVTSKNATKNILQTGGGNRLIIEDAVGQEYIHLATPHKRTFLHMGSTFNPQYNAIKNTDGTSLTYTTQLATTFVGDDNETIVERARVTVIGRGTMTTGIPTGEEVAALLGTTFITALEADIGADDAETAGIASALAAQTAQKAAAKAVAAAVAAWGKVTTPPPAPTDPTYAAWNALLQAAITASNAAGLGTPVSTSVAAGNPPGTTEITTTLGQMTTDYSGLSSAIAGISTTAPTTAQITAAVNQVTALSTAITNLGTYLTKFDTANLPDSPSSNVLPTYINLQRAQPDPTAPAVTPQPDATGMDILGAFPPNVPELNPGSDVKVVGGDNVTMVQHDARSHVVGTSYGLVLGGQAAVVRNAQRSKVLSPDNSGLFDTAMTPPTTFTPLSFPGPLASLDAGTAQTSEVYGNQLSWVDGTVTSTVTHGKHAEVFSPLQSPGASNTSPSPVTPNGAPTHVEANTAQSTALHGDQFSWVDGTVTTTVSKGSHSEIFAPSPAASHGAPVHTEPTTAQSTALHGDQFVWIDGNKTSTVNGHVDSTVNGGQTAHISGGQTTWVDHQATHIKEYALKTEMSSFDFNFLMKLSMATGIAMSINTLKIDLTVLSLKSHSYNLAAHVACLKTCGIFVIT